MEKLDDVVVFSVFLISLMAVMALIYLSLERSKKKAIGNRFRAFRNGHTLSQKDLRAVSRITVPDSMDVVLTLKQSGKKIKAYVVDISFSGLSVKTNLSFKKMTIDSVSGEAWIGTPINRFHIQSLKLVRIERQPRGQFMAFSIHKMEESQFEELKSFLKYLDEFLTHEQNKN